MSLYMCYLCGEQTATLHGVCTNPRCLRHNIVPLSIDNDKQIVSVYNKCYLEAINIIFKDKSMGGVAEDTIILLAIALFNKGFTGGNDE